MGRLILSRDAREGGVVVEKYGNKLDDKAISKEERRLKNLLGIKKLKDAPPKLQTAMSLINNTAFMTVLLESLQKEITEHGCTEEYQNGENQKGVKKSAAFDAFTSTMKNYMAAVKQLCDLAPEGTELDELQKFVSGVK